MAPTALLSVSDKAGLLPLAQGLLALGYQLFSSGGTAAALAAADLPVTRVSEVTGAPEILGGRVKTLHPSIHGGILAKRDDPDHLQDLEARAIQPIDLVVVNLYPFTRTVAQPDIGWQEAIEQIDIGGPALVRAAAKNHAHVAVLTDPAQYPAFLQALQAGVVDGALRRRLALAAFQHTAAYDAAISAWWAEQLRRDEESDTSSERLVPPQALKLDLPALQPLRYGENPHQPATWYGSSSVGWGAASQRQGKELSFNNLMDLEAALACVREFGYGEHPAPPPTAAAVVIKHTTPCGVATGETAVEALRRALDADAVSAFGGIVALNRPVDAACAEALTSLFLECVVAPAYSEDACARLATKANLRVLELSGEAVAGAPRRQLRSLLGGVLAQESDDRVIEPETWQVVSARQPSEHEWLDLRFAWQVVRHVRSNAIVVASGGQTLGIGAGQTNRVGAARLALEAAGHGARGAVLASDGFLPFVDTIRLAAAHGIRAVSHPGGRLRDGDSLAACDAHAMAMLTTGRRHFLH
ncbi:MAG: bifunctional phosphoribosylaminoimidazolecarboxamide formyltransferase/IMP cyclohydrolase [Cyanobacteriota bacterium]